MRLLALILTTLPILSDTPLQAQGADSTKEKHNLSFSGYTQPQSQIASRKGIESYEGGDFPAHTNNRMMLRRNRVSLHYRYGQKELERVHFVFEIDATERGISPRDLWLRLALDRRAYVHLTTGLMKRPFGYEVTRSSSQRESPERGRMSQILMKGERDLGIALRLAAPVFSQDQTKASVTLGVFNGPGMQQISDYDNYKDVAGCIRLNDMAVAEGKINISAGLSLLYGSIESRSPYVYRLQQQGDAFVFFCDSSKSFEGKAAPRHYYGADIQLKLSHGFGTSELRAEYIFGQQSGSSLSSETPAPYPSTAGQPLPLYIRPFQGAYLYLIQELFQPSHKVILKYDFYDPNTKVKARQIALTSGFSEADLCYQTFGFGYLYDAPELPLRLTAYYSHVINESSSLPGYVSDRVDNVFTLRLQYQF